MSNFIKKIKNKDLPPYIIAEAGVIHNGNFLLAMNMIEIAASSGVDAIKFQTFNSKDLAIPSAEKAIYQKKNTDKIWHHSR